MNRRFPLITAPLFTAAVLSLFALGPAVTVRAAGSPEQGDSAQALSLAVTEKKLAALALEAMKDNASTVAGQAIVEQKVAEKKGGEKKRHAAKKKRLTNVAHKGIKVQEKAEPKRVLNIVDRRLTPAEVHGVLTSTRDFSGSDLSGMNLVGMDFSGVKFNRANLHHANLERADLAEADLELADLTGANLRGASLIQVHLRGTRMDDTRLDGALWVDRTVCKKGSVGSCIE